MYRCWGHPTGNNCTFAEGRAELLGALDSAGGYLAHNAGFEASVLREHFGYECTDPLAVHDTQYDLFLYNPYASTFALKPSAERLLGLPPSEQDAVREWVLQHVAAATPKTWGAYISLAPGDLVAPYAEGDTDRTKAIHDLIHPRIIQMGMEAAYQREQRLMPILAESTRQGMPVDMEALARDIEVYMAARQISENYVRGVLGEVDLNKDAQIAEALDRKGLVTEWVLTATGKRSTARKNLMGRVKDPELMAHLAYWGVLSTCLGTFAGPWLAQALREGGNLHPQWNQVKGNYGTTNDAGGAKTGRMSCWDPNLQNVPNDFEDLKIPALVEKFFKELWPTLPRVMHMRRYLLPGQGRIWLKRDFSAQEMRIMSHYAEGQLFQWYLENPDTDPHEMVSVMMREKLGISLKRKALKIIAFGIMYGRGIDNLAAALGVTKEEATMFRNAYYELLPEVRELSNQCKRRGQNGEFVRTWGGRCYHREPSSDRDFSYRLMNYLIQGGAADQTKQSLIDWHAHRASDELLLAAVHDEINISVPVDRRDVGMYTLRAAMDADRFDVPFRSEGFAGPNWDGIEKYEPEMELV